MGVAPKSQARSRYEALLAGSHRTLYKAAELADENGDPGAGDDIRELMHWITVLVSDSLRGRRRPRRQTSLFDN